jgi:hypothetical protein
MLVLHPHQIKKNLPEAHLAHYTSSTGYPTDTEALDLVQKMHLNIFGSMPIPFQSWLENAILLIILVLNPVTTEVRVWIDDNYMGVERGFVPRTEAVTRPLQPWIFLLEQTVFMVRGHIGLMQTTEK